jgi:hypothetical protein
MTVICSWCGKIKKLDKVDEGYVTLDQTKVSHGICKSCMQKELAKLRQIKK